MTISVSGSSTAGESSSLVCKAGIAIQSNTPRPHFQWFFGPNNNSLPFRPPMTTNNGEMYRSTLQFSPLSQSHAGMYTCRLGGNARLAARTTLMVNGTQCICVSIIDFVCLCLDYFIVAPLITVKVTANLNAPLMVGQTDNTLTCDVSGAGNLNPKIDYQWTRNDGNTQTRIGTNSNTLSLSPLRLSKVGDYTCNVTVNSTLLNSNVSASADNSQSVLVQGEFNQSGTSINISFLFQQFQIHNLLLSLVALAPSFTMNLMSL